MRYSAYLFRKHKLEDNTHRKQHIIGFDHPGEGLSESEIHGGDEYTHSGQDQQGRDVHGPTDLMGGAMGLHPFYFNEWAAAVDEHIAGLRQQQTIEKLQRSIHDRIFGQPDRGIFLCPMVIQSLPRPPVLR